MVPRCGGYWTNSLPLCLLKMHFVWRGESCTGSHHAVAKRMGPTRLGSLSPMAPIALSGFMVWTPLIAEYKKIASTKQHKKYIYNTILECYILDISIMCMTWMAMSNTKSGSEARSCHMLCTYTL